MICPNCSYNNKGDGKCWLCEFQMTPEVVEVPYRIPVRSKKRQGVVDKDIAFFKEIWAERPHICEVSKEPLGDEFNVCFFSHVLAKQPYPRFRNYKKNIVLCTLDWHIAWETGDRSQKELRWVLELEDELKIEYYKPQPIV